MKRFLAFLLLSVGLRASCPDPMVFSGLGSNSTTTAASSYATTAAYQPNANAFCFAMVINSKATTPDLPTFSGNGLTWVQIATTNFNVLATPTERLTIFRATGSAPTSTTGTASFGTNQQTGCIVRVCQVTHVYNVIQTVVTGSNTTANPLITMAALNANGSNAVVAFFGNSLSTFAGTPEGSWTEDYDTGYATPSTGGYITYRLTTTDNTVNPTVASASWAGVALELEQERCPGTISGINIQTNGWVAEVNFVGGSTNSTYESGLVTPYNNPEGSENLKFTLTSQGYNNAGTLGTNNRTLYGTQPLRKPYPNEAWWADVYDSTGTNVVPRIAISDYIFSSDSNITAYLQPSLYGNTPLVATNKIATNSSTLSYSTAKVIGNWTWPDFDMIRSTNMVVRWTGGQAFARQGKPLACVIFQAIDEHSHTNTVTVTTPIIRNDVGDAEKVIEYIADMDAGSLTDGDTITIHVKAYPWIGSSLSVLDTSTSPFTNNTTFTNGTPFPHALHWMLNKSGAHSKATAVVAPSGNDSTGVVNTNNSTSSAAFLTISGAAAAIKATNNTLSAGANNTCGGGTILLSSGKWAYTSVPDDQMKTYLWIASHPTNATYPEMTNGPGSGRTGSLICFSNITFNISNNVNFPFFNHRGYWANKCTADTNNGCATIFDKGAMWFTGNKFTNWAQGFIAAEASQQPVHLIRGNTIAGPSTLWNCFTVVGNKATNRSAISGTFMRTLPSGDLYEADWSVIAFNRFLNINSTGGSTFNLWGGTEVLTNGCFIAQNLIEEVTANGPSFVTHPDSATGAFTNAIVWNNTFRGPWDNVFYNDTGTNAVPNIFCTEKNNLYQGRHTKTDTFAGTANSNRIGNWSAMWSVGNRGNYDLQMTNVPAAGGFAREFVGLNSWQPGRNGSANPINTFQTDTNYAMFFSEASYTGATGAGNGDYRIKGMSPLNINWKCDWVLPYDLDGRQRSQLDPAGAFAIGVHRHGNGQ